MNVYLLAFLFVFILPLVTGVLFALLLREVHIRHPLPLGGTIGKRKTPKPKPLAKTQEAPADAPTEENNVPEGANDAPPTDSTNEQAKQIPSEVSVFDGTENLPQNLPVHDLLNAMTTETAAITSNNLEDRVDASARSTQEISEEHHSVADDTDHENLVELAKAFPKAKIDFSQELENTPELGEAISPMAKEVLGENYDFDTLEQQSLRSGDGGGMNDSEVMALDIQEDESGTVQVSSPAFLNVVPQLADFAAPQTIFSIFSDDWIQEMNSNGKVIEGDLTKFCFTEESQPMFVRKKKG